MGAHIRSGRLFTIGMLVLPLMAVGGGVVAATSEVTPDPDRGIARTLGDLIERTDHGWQRVRTIRTRMTFYEAAAEW